jgi:hypothetical protein
MVPLPENQYLSGWKDITRYLGRGVRTVQRYEGEMGLPIHRPAGRSRGTVIAAKTELDTWATGGHGRSGAKQWPLDETNRMGAEFLQIDSEIALTFSGIALTATDKETKRRTTLTARRAYNSIMQLRRNIELTDRQRKKLNGNLHRLKRELRGLAGHSSSVSRSS